MWAGLTGGEQSLRAPMALTGSIGSDGECAPDAVDGRSTEASDVRDRAPTPRPSSRRRWLERSTSDVRNVFVGDPTGGTRARSIVKSSKTFLDEPVQPLADRDRSHAKPLGDCSRLETVHGRKNNGCTQGTSTCRTSACGVARPSFEGEAFFWSELKREQGLHRPASVCRGWSA